MMRIFKSGFYVLSFIGPIGGHEQFGCIQTITAIDIDTWVDMYLTAGAFVPSNIVYQLECSLLYSIKTKRSS